MRHLHQAIAALAFCLLLACCAAPQVTALPNATPAPADDAPNEAESEVDYMFPFDIERLAVARAQIAAGNPPFVSALNALRRQADKALAIEPLSVVAKTQTPPSGDKHDYLSLAPYFWPNPNAANGMPYVRRDGQVNPERDHYPDHAALNRMESSANTLALAFYFTHDERYAARAATLVRAWYLDDATRMNPNLNFAQFVPGANDGRGAGIIDTQGLPVLLDDIQLLPASAWTEADNKGMAAWLARYLDWLQTSPNGRHEAKALNNHGSWYAGQVAAIQLFLSQRDGAAATLEAVKGRIASQVAPDGSQPQELSRTRSWSYSAYNLRALTQLALLGQRAGVDLWGYQTADGRSIRRAIDYVLPSALGQRAWEGKQITPLSASDLIVPLRQAAAAYGSDTYMANSETLLGAAAKPGFLRLIAP